MYKIIVAKTKETVAICDTIADAAACKADLITIDKADGHMRRAFTRL